MKTLTYFAVFETLENGFSVYFPDLPGCISCGDTFEDTKKQATEALELHLWGMKKDNEEIPEPSVPPFDEKLEANSFVCPITICPEIVDEEMKNRAVKKTLTIPYWLNELAEENNINFSQLLQWSIKKYLKIS